MNLALRISLWLAASLIVCVPSSAQVQLLAQSTSGPLSADDVNADSAFGYSVAIDGDTVAVGAPSADGIVSDTGAVYVFVRDQGTWTLQAKLVAELAGAIPDAAAGDRFGSAVALAGDTLVIGSPGYENPLDACIPDPSDANAECPDCAYGAAYIFQRGASAWFAVQRLEASDRDKLDQFGISVALTTDAIVVGAPFEDDFTLLECDPPDQTYASTCDSGAAYIFEHDGTSWAEVAKIGAGADAAAADRFGEAVAMDAGVVVVGAPRKSDTTGAVTACRVGAAYVFEKTGTTWSTIGIPLHDHTTATLDHDAFDGFGASVAVDLGTIAIGAPRARSDTIEGITGSSGAVHVFASGSSGWELQSRVTSSIATENVAFGTAIGLFRDTLCVGAPHARDELLTRTGAVHVFKRVGESWTEEPMLRPTAANALERFGHAVDVDGDSPASLVVGSWLADPMTIEDAGTAWIFETEVFHSFCFGSNGSGGCGSCPCGNDAPPGTRGGCLNANTADGHSWSGGTGSSARLIALGTASASANALSFKLTSASQDSFAVLLSAPSPLPNPSQSCPSGIGIQAMQLDGLRCIGMGVVRHATVAIDGNGDSVVGMNPNNGWGPPSGPPQGVLAQAGVVAGQTRLFQTHYRELPNVVCSRGQNTSNAIAITAVP